jgi:hypothetical protein
MAVTDFLDNSDTPSDKVAVPPLAGSFSALARYGAFSPRRTVEPVAHGLDYEVMPDGIWSINEVDWFPFGVTPPDVSGAQPTFQTTEVDVYADGTNVYVVCSNYTASAATIHYVVELYSKD